MTIDEFERLWNEASDKDWASKLDGAIIRAFIAEQKEMPPEFNEVLNKHYWELLGHKDKPDEDKR